MPGIDDDRDPVIADALERLRPPDARPAFWAALDGRLRAAAPTRRRSRWPALAAAAIVALAAIGAVALANRDDTGDPFVSDPTTTTSTSTPTTSTTPTGEPDSAAAAVLAWVDALEEGDHDRALELLAPNSEAYARQTGGDVDAFISTLAEGYGAWGASSDRETTTTAVESSGEGAIEVVVLSGTVQQEGETSTRNDAIPVRFSRGTYRVEPFDFADTETRIEFVHPEIGPDGALPLAVGDAIEVVTPSADQVTFRLDDGAPFTVEPDRRGWVRYDANGSIETGDHLVLVVSVGPEHVTAAALRFTVR
jgi:hypothetical protein